MSLDNVVDMAAYRPHVSGSAKCLDCAHAWAAVAPNAVEWLECPACALMRGRFVYGCVPPDGTLVFTCECGNDIFHMTDSGAFCLNCGVTHVEFMAADDEPPAPAA